MRKTLIFGGLFVTALMAIPLVSAHSYAYVYTGTGGNCQSLVRVSTANSHVLGADPPAPFGGCDEIVFDAGDPLFSGGIHLNQQ